MKKFTQYGFWFGVLLACTPLLMFFYGGARQFQLSRAWDEAQATQASVSAPASGDDSSTEGDDGLARLNIPKLNIHAMIVGDITSSALAEGPGHVPSTALPGENGNCVLAAHRNVWGSWFRDLDKLEPGDKVVVETLKQHFYYRVTGKTTVLPDDTSVLKSHGHKAEITLITCTLPVTHRIVVRGVLDHTSTT